jgi:iron only hydrogenase large subunit-like protein
MEMQPASISLTDCLACSGCITTAESVLVAQQSDSEIYQVLEANARAKKVRISL